MNPKPSFLEGFKQKLKIRKEPKTQKEFFRHIRDEDQDEGDEEREREIKKPRETEEREPEKPSEQEPEEEETKRPQLKRVQIIDKSATSAIDRDLILKRIKEAKMSRLPGAPPPPPMEPILEEPEELEEKVEEKVEAREPEIEAPKAPQKIKIRVSKKRVTIKAPEPGEPVPPPPMEEVVPTEPTEKRKRGRPKLKIVSKVPIKEVLIEDAAIVARLPKHEKVVQRVSSYYMNNRKIAVEKLRRLFEPERREFQEKKRDRQL